MTTKKKPAKKAPAKPRKAKDYKLLLVLDDKAQKHLETAHKITGEKTATKAIIQCMVNADHYMKEFNALKERYEQMEYNLQNNTSSIKSYLDSLKALHEVVFAKPGTKKKPVLKECECCGDMVEHLDKNGDCPDCSSI
jgi:hypothetical protein